MGLLAILGRGVQRLKADSDPTDVASYVTTEDIEICDEKFAHLPVRVPADDEHPNAIVGGGQLNLLTGAELVRTYHPQLVVCAYGGRSPYLESINGPSESEIMSAELSHMLGTAPIHVWPREKKVPGPANTGTEIRNVLDLAIDREIYRIMIVTVGVHVPRTGTFVAKLLSQNARYRDLAPVVLESEEILVGANEHYVGRVKTLRDSKSFARNWAREANGCQHIIRQTY